MSNTKDNVLLNTTMLRLLLQKRQFKLKQLAEDVGVSEQCCQNWVWGRCKPTRENFDKICEVLNVEANLLEGTSSEIVARGAHVRVLRFFLNELLGENPEPQYKEVRQMMQDLQDIKDPEESDEVKKGEISIPIRNKEDQHE